MSEVPFGELLSAGLEASAKLDADVAQIRLDLAVARSQTARAAAKRRELELQHSSLIKTNASQTKLLHSLLPLQPFHFLSKSIQFTDNSSSSISSHLHTLYSLSSSPLLPLLFP